ncbi:hypothetical protein JKP88DRAFT_200068 [Tribonema minus]|uniref:Uncharacterized protein n=1 Tax=Tribonema minus TaxID=303371 RepID=A0A835YTU3_9STRA|nr:hypothetical protein JKP88DRAFT_200068 [Tribonema minus]
MYGGYANGDREDWNGSSSGARGGGMRRGGPQPQVGPGQPFQIYKEVANIGKTVESSKKRICWRFSFGEEGDEHEVVLEHSTLSGKKKLYVNGEQVFESQKVRALLFFFSNTVATLQHTLP